MKTLNAIVPLLKPFIAPKSVLFPEIEKTLYSGQIAQGPRVLDFEKSFAELYKFNNTIAVNSGSAALHIALILAGVSPGDEVITTAMTAEPTNTNILMTGAEIVWGDVDICDGNLSPADVERKITKKTKAIVVVHYAGYPADISKFNEISKKYKIPIIEDAAHALGAKYDGKFIGTHSDYVIFSFQAIKHLTTIDGGALVINTNDETTLERARKIRWFGLDKSVSRQDNIIKEMGYKYNMNDVTATIGLVQLKYIEEIISRYVENGKFYDSSLIGVPGLELVSLRNKVEPSYWLYTLKVKDRDNFIRRMSEKNIAVGPIHKRNDLHTIFSKSKAKLENLDKFYSEYVHIPVGWWVDGEVREYIADAIKEGW